MLQNAKFYLIQKTSNPVGSFTTAASIIPFTTDEGNSKACKRLNYRLTEQLPNTAWHLSFNSSGFTSEMRQFSHSTIHQSNVVISGEILKKLHTLILYNATNARLKMKMSSECSSRFSVYDGSRTIQDLKTTLKCETELFPHVDGQGNISYSNSNTSSSSVNSQKGSTAAAGGSVGFHNNLQLRILTVWVEGIDYDLSYTPHPDLLIGQKRLLESGIYSDVKMLAIGDAEVPCHKNILSGQSPILETMLKSKAFRKGQTGLISMTDYSKEEVMSFLAFLYYADLEIALTDTDRAVTLCEMGFNYDVKGLQNGIKPIVLSRPADTFEVDAAIRLFHVACGLNDLDLKRKAADILETRSSEEVCRSLWFKCLSAEVLRELFEMSRREP